MIDNTGVEPQDAPSQEPTTPQVEPVTTDTTTTTFDPTTLMARLDELESKLKSSHAENADKRFKLKSRQEQLDALAAEHETFKADYQSKVAELEALTAEIKEFREAQEAERTALLDSMKEEHRTMFGDLPLDKLKAFHKEFYGSPAQAPTPSVGAKKPVNTSEVMSEDPSVFGLSRIRNAFGR